MKSGLLSDWGEVGNPKLETMLEIKMVVEVDALLFVIGLKGIY